MKSGIYNIKVAAQHENPEGYGLCTLMLKNGIVFAELLPVHGDYEVVKEQADSLDKINAHPAMKDHERIFFALCYNLRNIMKPREVVNLLADTIPHKRCWYYLDKWHALGFYSSGVSSDLGWFYPENLPPRYREIVEETKK